MRTLRTAQAEFSWRGAWEHTQFPSGVSSDLKKSFEFKLACFACSSILEGYEKVLIKHMRKRTHYLEERISLMYNLRNIKIEFETAYNRTGMVLWLDTDCLCCALFCFCI